MPTLSAAPLLVLFFAASAFPWLLLLRQRFGQLLAVPATAGWCAALSLATLAISHAVNLNYMVALIGASVIAAVAGAWIASRRSGVLRRPGPYAVALWCPALLGGLVWCVTVLTAQFVPGHVSLWLGHERRRTQQSLVRRRHHSRQRNRSGPVHYAVPLSTALIATAVGAGSPSSSSARRPRASPQAFTLVWVILLVVVCAAVGVVVRLTRFPSSIRLVALVSALGSLLPLTWFFSGLIIQWGYFNIDVALPVRLPPGSST